MFLSSCAQFRKIDAAPIIHVFIPNAINLEHSLREHFQVTLPLERNCLFVLFKHSVKWLEASFSFSFLNVSSAVSVQHKGRGQKCPLHLKSTNFSSPSLQSAVYSGSDSVLREMLVCWSRQQLKYEREKGRRRMTFHTAHALNRLETLLLILGQSITGCDIMNGLKSEGNNERERESYTFFHLV